MESRNKSAMCRLCLCENESLIDIFELNDQQGCVPAEVISDLFQFQVSETDAYPHVVCSTCLTKLTDFKLFKECCQKSKVIYDHMFALNEALIKHDSEVEDSLGGSYVELCEEDPLKDASLLEAGHDGSNLEFHEQDPLRDSSSDDEEGGKGTVAEKRIGGRNGRFDCHCCGKVLMTKGSLKWHLASHGIGNFFKCDVCGKICVSKWHLIRHTRVHTGERPYKCTDCSVLFRNHSNLKEHMRIHTKTKPFKCKECNFSFSQSSNLKAHMRLHSNLRPYSCGVCHLSFRWKSNLTSHMRTHSGDRPFKCTVCSKAFSRSSNLRKHQFVHLGERPHPCPQSANDSVRGEVSKDTLKQCVCGEMLESEGGSPNVMATRDFSTTSE